MSRSKLTILFSFLFSCLIAIRIAGVSEIYAQGGDSTLPNITLVSADEESLKFPGYLEGISPVIKNVLTDTPNESAAREIGVPISGSALKCFQMLISILPQAARDVNGKEVDLKNATLQQLRDKIIFSNTIVQKEISKKGIQRLSDDDLNEVAHISAFLKIDPLTNALAHFIAKRIDTSSRIQWDIPKEYIIKHQAFMQSKLTEYTVADCFAEQGQESFILEGSQGLILDLSNKKLTGLQGLEKLDYPELMDQIILDYNPLQHHDWYGHSDVFKRFTQLRFLSMRSNQLLELPGDLFENLSELRELYLSNNQLTRLPKRIFNDLYQLNVLNLDDNMLGTLDTKTFIPLKELRSLSLRNNRLRELPSGIFDSLGNLQTLCLSNNKLEKIESIELFQKLNSLERIELDHNRFTELPKDMFRSLTHLRYADLRNNHISNVKDNFSGHTVKETIQDHIGVPQDTALFFYPQAGKRNYYLNRLILCGKVTGIVGGGIFCLPAILPPALCGFKGDEECFDCCISKRNPVNSCYGPSVCTWACQSPMCYKD